MVRPKDSTIADTGLDERQRIVRHESVRCFHFTSSGDCHSGASKGEGAHWSLARRFPRPVRLLHHSGNNYEAVAVLGMRRSGARDQECHRSTREFQNGLRPPGPPATRQLSVYCHPESTFRMVDHKSFVPWATTTLVLQRIFLPGRGACGPDFLRIAVPLSCRQGSNRYQAQEQSTTRLRGAHRSTVQ